MIVRELEATAFALRTWLASPQFNGRSHGMERPVYISLTSYPRRFPTLALTLKSLLRQSVKADGVLLWIAGSEISKLPRSVTRLKADGLMIMPCEPVGSFSKIVHALQDFPEATIVTADDDCYYSSDWLAGLVAGSSHAPGSIVCYAARRMILSGQHGLAPYGRWPMYPKGEGAMLLPLGSSGVLYPPHVLHPDVLDVATYQRLSPKADDLWLKWMSARVATTVSVARDAPRLVYWPGTQHYGLRRSNVSGGGNDRQAANLIEAYGLPQC